MSYVISNSYPYLEELGTLINTLSAPYPKGIWQQNNSYPYLPVDANDVVEVLLEPLPQGIYNQKKGEYPRFGSLELIRLGAFTYASNLEEVVIPESVKYIGEWAFRFTKLKEVTIASDCQYFDTSFPEGCVVHFYSDIEPNFITKDGCSIWTADDKLFMAKEE